LAVLVGSIPVPIGRSAQEPPECTVTLQANESLQANIDRAAEHDVLCLAAGRWGENLVVEKSLTLRSLNVGEAIITATQRGYPVIWIRTPEDAQTISVKLDGLTITGAHGECADEESGICAAGVLIEGSAQAEITESNITWNVFGVRLMDSAQAAITNSSISRSWIEGMVIEGLSRAKLTYSTISDSLGDGLWLEESGYAEVTLSAVSGSKAYGIVLSGSAQLELSESIIQGNGSDGVSLREASRAIIKKNYIIRNWGYGVALYQQPCYENDGVFSGRLSGRKNAIPGPGEPNRNGKGAVCPPELEFLMTEEGGEYP